MALKGLLGRSAAPRAAERLYLRAVEQARDPGFYADWGVPDTVDGRFEMIALHVYLLLRRLREGGAVAAETSQALFDAMFDDMDRCLREMGVGDLGVGRRVKAMAQAFYGRVAAYDRGLATDDNALAEALGRNVFRSESAPPQPLSALAGYLRTEAAALSAQPLDALLQGNVHFGKVPGKVRQEGTASHPSGA